MQLPDLESLHCFAEAARLLNFRAAARSVALTPAALGQRIKLLEDQMGQSLFHRTTRKVVLTQAGLQLLPHALSTLEQAQRCLRAGQGDAAPWPVELTLGTRHELGMSWVLPMVPLLQDAHPGMTLNLYFGSGADLLIRVRTLEIDCAIGSMRITDSKLDSVRLHREDYVLVGSPQLLKRTPLRTHQDARAHAFLDATAEMPLYGYLRDAAAGGESWQFGRVLRMGTIDAIRHMVLQGAGVAVLPLYLVEKDLQEKRLVRVLPEMNLASDHFRLIFRADDPRRALYESLARRMLAAPLE